MAMTREQFLLIKLAEECTEVAKMALKTSQFGFDESRNGDFHSNLQRLQEELNDVYASLSMLEEETEFWFIPDEDKVKIKIEKVSKYYNYSKELGMVE